MRSDEIRALCADLSGKNIAGEGLPLDPRSGASGSAMIGLYHAMRGRQTILRLAGCMRVPGGEQHPAPACLSQGIS